MLNLCGGCGRWLKIDEFKQAMILRSLKLSGLISPDMMLRSCDYIMVLNHCPGCKGITAPKASFRLFRKTIGGIQLGELEYLESTKKYRQEEEETKCPDCGVSFGLHHVDCPLSEDHDDPVIES